MNSDYYEILGVSKSSSDQEIKKAFRKKAVELHPDRNKAPDATEKFKKVNEAYQVLSDPQKRKMYDQFGSSAFQGGGQGGYGPGSYGDVQFDFSDLFGEGFDSIFGGNPFDQIFGGAGNSKQKSRGKDVAIRIEIDLKDVITGPEKEIEYTHKEVCKTCTGKGGEKVQTCKNCNGSGRVQQVTRSLFGNVQVVRECPSCNGTGQEILEKCKTCHGNSIVDVKKKLKIRIPSGIESGMNLRFTSEGDAGKFNNPAGDLYIEVNIIESHFRRVGNNLEIEKEISLYAFVLGEEIVISTLDGDQKIKVSEGTEVGTVVSIKGLGIPDIRTKKRGDINIKLKAIVPKKLSKEEKELFTKLKEIREHKKSFWT